MIRSLSDILSLLFDRGDTLTRTCDVIDLVVFYVNVSTSNYQQQLYNMVMKHCPHDTQVINTTRQNLPKPRVVYIRNRRS